MARSVPVVRSVLVRGPLGFEAIQCPSSATGGWLCGACLSATFFGPRVNDVCIFCGSTVLAVDTEYPDPSYSRVGSASPGYGQLELMADMRIATTTVAAQPTYTFRFMGQPFIYFDEIGEPKPSKSSNSTRKPPSGHREINIDTEDTGNEE